jgi:hypothetical protein
MRMRREACHDGLAQLAKVVREAGHFVAAHPGIDEQHAGRALHDNGIGLQEVAPVDKDTLRDLYQHGAAGRSSAANWPGTKVRISATTPSAMRSTSIASGR